MGVSSPFLHLFPAATLAQMIIFIGYINILIKTLQFLIKGFFSRYITYSKEEEAVCCIQNVHGFVLEGRPLRYKYSLKLVIHGIFSIDFCSSIVCVFGFNISGLVLEPQNIVMHGSEMWYENYWSR